MKPISEKAAAALLQRWRISSETVYISLDASATLKEGGIVTDVQSSPGQIVVTVSLLSPKSLLVEKKLVLTDCSFEGDEEETLLLARFPDKLRVLRFDTVGPPR